jgi:UrcA family protein
MKTLLILGLLATFATPVAAEVHAARPDAQIPVRTVTFGDLDLARAQGADALLMRLKAAGRKVCGDRPYAGDTGAYRRYRACVGKAVQRAVDDIGSPVVSARHSGSAVLASK